MTRRVTVTYELPEELCRVLERQAAREGRHLEDLLADHMAGQHRPRLQLTPEELERRRAAFERHLGAWDSGEADSSDNERLDADLAREYGRHDQQGN